MATFFSNQEDFTDAGWWATTSTSATTTDGRGYVMFNPSWASQYIQEYTTSSGTYIGISKKKSGLHPALVFKYMKSKLTYLGDMRYKRRIGKLKKLSEKYLRLGQMVLSEKFLRRLAEEIKLSEIYGAGVKAYILRSDVNKHKRDVRDGHIADTIFDKYTAPIPDDILKKKKALDKLKLFDDYIVYHYWNEGLEEKKEKKESMSVDEKSAMRDPILFGVCKEIPDKMFFIADWEDENCDLTFTELVDKIAVDEENIKVDGDTDSFESFLDELKEKIKKGE